jgi:hypothetical protein
MAGERLVHRRGAESAEPDAEARQGWPVARPASPLISSLGTPRPQRLCGEQAVTNLSTPTAQQ